MMAGLLLAGSDLGSWCCAYMCGGSRLSGVNIIGLMSTGCWLQLDNEPEHTLNPHENQLKTKEDQGAWAMSFPERLSDSSLVKQLLNQQSWWPVSDHLAGEETEHGGPGLLWSHVVWGLYERTAEFLETTSETAYGDITIQLWRTFQQAACHLDTPSVIKLHLSERPFIAASPKHTWGSLRWTDHLS